MKRFVIYLIVILGIVASFLFDPNIRAKATALWDGHIIVGGLDGSDGVPVKVSSDGSVYVNASSMTSDINTTGSITGATIYATGTGQSTFDEGLVVNEDSGSTVTDNFRVETGDYEYAFMVDAPSNTVGVSVPIVVGNVSEENPMSISFPSGAYITQKHSGYIDVVGKLQVRDATTEDIMYKYSTAKICFHTATGDASGPIVSGYGTAQKSVGLTGVDETGGTEGYVSFDNSIDYLRFTMPIPSTYVYTGASSSIVIQFDMLETGAAQCDYNVSIYKQGTTTALYTDTIAIANNAERAASNTIVTNSTGIARDSLNPDDVLLIEMHPTANADTANIYGARLKYSCGIQATQQ